MVQIARPLTGRICPLWAQRANPDLLPLRMTPKRKRSASNIHFLARVSRRRRGPSKAGGSEETHRVVLRQVPAANADPSVARSFLT